MTMDMAIKLKKKKIVLEENNSYDHKDLPVNI